MPALLRLFAACLLLACGSIAGAQTFPKFDDSGVVDAAGILDPAQEQALSQKLIAQKKASERSLIVATIPDLQGYDISDYGYRLLRDWGVGDKERNDGAILIVAPSERKVRIEVGYGLEGILTDALSSRIIRNDITPRFKAGDMPGGIDAGVNSISTLLALPPDEARKQAALAEQEQRAGRSSGANAMVIFWVVIIFAMVILPMITGGGRGRRYRRGSGPVILWGPTIGGSSWGGGGSDWGGGGGGGWSGGGGFSGGGGGGGGGASGGW